MSGRMMDWLWGGLALLLWQPTQAQMVVEYIHTDALGSVVLVTDQSRNVLERREYEPYGLQLTPVIQDGPGYTGHVQDAVTGLTYMQQRYYDPGIGASLSVDPVTAYDKGDMRFFNRYAYAFNNPYKFTDPDGRCPTCDRFSDNYAQAVSEGRGSEFDAFEGPAIAVTGAALAATPGVGTLLAVGFRQLTRSEARVESPKTDAKPSEPPVTQQNPKNLIPTQTRSEMSGSQVKRIASDMKKNGYDQSQPVDAVRNGKGRLEIQDGHHRTEAAKSAGIDKIPVRVWEPKK